MQMFKQGISTSVTFFFSAFYIGGSSSESIFISPSVRHSDIASPVWCFTPARWTISQSNLENCKRHLASLLGASENFNKDLNKSPSVRIVSSLPSRYGRRCSPAHKMARNYRFVVSSTRSALVSEIDRCPISFVVSSGFTWSSTQRLANRRHLYQESIAFRCTVLRIPAEEQILLETSQCVESLVV